MISQGLRGLGVALICLTVLLSGGWSWTSFSSHQQASHPSSGWGQALHEVAPPEPVQHLQQRLSDFEPQLRILSPCNDELLKAGIWTLKIEIANWPLVNAGRLGLGPHVVVQLDEQPPLRLTMDEGSGRSAEISSSSARTVVLERTMPQLTPGSHRLTVYAAQPWGESVKVPGAATQIRLHRVAANPLTLPPPGSPQLIGTIPFDLPTAEPVLIDWLLIDAPLQHLREDDEHWRLRITVNGESVLIDRQEPLWLEGLQSGSNSVQLELLDGLGEALNPPFNSLIREVSLEPDQPRRWQDSLLSRREQDELLGLQPPQPTEVESSTADIRLRAESVADRDGETHVNITDEEQGQDGPPAPQGTKQEQPQPLSQDDAVDQAPTNFPADEPDATARESSTGTEPVLEPLAGDDDISSPTPFVGDENSIEEPSDQDETAKTGWNDSQEAAHASDGLPQSSPPPSADYDIQGNGIVTNTPSPNSDVLARLRARFRQ